MNRFLDRELREIWFARQVTSNSKDNKWKINFYFFLIEQET